MNNRLRMAAAELRKKWKPGCIGCLVVGLTLLALFISGYIWLKVSPASPHEAPEVERVLNAQIGMPFQVLIPAYLPKSFNRERMEIRTDQPGPQGEAMIQLIYTTRQGYNLTLNEWIPKDQDSGNTGSNVRHCVCICRSNGQCQMTGVELTVGAVHIKVGFSEANLLAYDQLQFVLDTLGPAANRQVYSTMKEVPIAYTVPPAVDVPVNAEGVQEITLVVTPQGYSPVHFAVKKGVPVRLTFRQLGQVGCGDELILQRSPGKSSTLQLASPNDNQVIEFTPDQTGDYPFNCPHQIYRGVMTVKE